LPKRWKISARSARLAEAGAITRRAVAHREVESLSNDVDLSIAEVPICLAGVRLMDQ
jgi:hypothetical protein